MVAPSTPPSPSRSPIWLNAAVALETQVQDCVQQQRRRLSAQPRPLPPTRREFSLGERSGVYPAGAEDAEANQSLLSSSTRCIQPLTF